MESAGIFQAGSHFFKMHHMIFLKMPTDNGDIEKVTAEKITGAMGDEREKVCCFLKQVQMAGNEEAQSKVVFSKEETQALDSFAEKLHCSVRTIQRAIKQLVQAGYIKVKHRFATTNLYSILHKVVNAAVNTVAEKAKQFKKGFEKKEKKSFNNFEPRTYNADELEKQLIERSRNCLL